MLRPGHLRSLACGSGPSGHLCDGDVLCRGHPLSLTGGSRTSELLWDGDVLCPDHPLSPARGSEPSEHLGCTNTPSAIRLPRRAIQDISVRLYDGDMPGQFPIICHLAALSYCLLIVLYCR